MSDELQRYCKTMSISQPSINTYPTHGGIFNQGFSEGEQVISIELYKFQYDELCEIIRRNGDAVSFETIKDFMYKLEDVLNERHK